MIWVEIPAYNEPVIYRAKHFRRLVPREQRRKVYKFSNKAQAIRLLLKYKLDAGFIQGQIILDMLKKFDPVPEVYPCQRAREAARVRDWLTQGVCIGGMDDHEFDERIEHNEQDPA